MFYTIYKTTNLINGKFYIGKHQTKVLNDGYIGSGKLLKRAIKKHGLDNFHKEILHVCESEKQMNALEKILVVPDSELNYNLCDGGKGGWSFVNREGYNCVDVGHKILAGKIGGNRFKNRIMSDDKFRQEIVERSRKNLLLKPLINGFKGKKHTNETLDKMRKTKNAGNKNSQYGTCWITNGIENKKIKKEELDFWIELGYNKGRIMRDWYIDCAPAFQAG